VSRTFSLRL